MHRRDFDDWADKVWKAVHHGNPFKFVHTPALVDLQEKGDQIIMKVDLPGMSRDDIDLQVTDSTINIHGIRPCPREDDVSGRIWAQERFCGEFQREISLPTTIDSSSANAKFLDGVLTIQATVKRTGTRVNIE